MEQPNEYVQAPTPEAPVSPFVPVSGQEMTGWDTYFSEQNLNYYYDNMQTLIAAPYEMTSTVVEGMIALKKQKLDPDKDFKQIVKDLIAGGYGSPDGKGGTTPRLGVTKDPVTGAPAVLDPEGSVEQTPAPGHGPQKEDLLPTEVPPAEKTSPIIDTPLPGEGVISMISPLTEEVLERKRESGRNLGEGLARVGFGSGAASTAIALSAMGSVGSGEVKGDRTEDVNDKLLKQIKSNEDMKLEPYRLGKEKYYTIGVGHYLDGSPGSRKHVATVLPKVKYKDIQEGRVSLTKDQAEQLMVLDIQEKRKQTIKALEGGKYKWEELPQDLKNHLIDATFRGSFIPMKNEEGQQIGSPNTIKLIKQGKFREAAKEFIDRSDYRKAKKTGVNRGIIKRMDAIHDALIRAAEYFEIQGA